MSEFEANWKCPTLAGCLREVRRYFPSGQMIQCELSTPSGVVPHPAPRYLYRGECGLFPTTESSHARIERVLDGRERDSLRRVVDALRWVFKQDGYDNSEWDTEGLLEHYGVPTGIVNVTSSLDVAAAFAASGDSDRGRICILTKPYRGGASFVDYTAHPWAERALRQKAFGIRPTGFTDLKSREADLRLGAVWVEFPLTALDREIGQWRRNDLVDASNDPHSAMVRGEVNHFVERFGKLPHGVARCLAERMPMVPLLHKVSDVDAANREVVTYRVAPSACAYSEDVERAQSLRYWSEEYQNASDSLEAFYPFATPRERGVVFAWPGTYHPRKMDCQVLFPDALTRSV
jgi:hypothetical protein